jgi:hypothetical protein
MNNNRQPNNNNRRRGRSNNNRPQGNNNNRNGFDYQNRIDNRARGNASQMLEKYKKLASDAQHNDDRVNAEYYLQFADHYFRVLADFRSRQEARQEERRPNRDEERDDGRDDGGNLQESGDNDYQADNMAQDNDDAQDAHPQERQGQERAPRQAQERPERPERQPRRERTARPPRRHHSEETDDGEQGGEQSGLDLAVLPPSISLPSGNDDEEAQAKPARKPRARKPKAADNSDVATAAE